MPKPLYDILHKHGVIPLLYNLWIMGACTWVLYRSFGDNPPDIPTGTTAAIATVFGLPAIMIGLWQWRSGKKDKGDDI